ncbi:MAG: hypothetical protein AAGD92_09495 [Pseudomonadota bacterium]
MFDFRQHSSYSDEDLESSGGAMLAVAIIAILIAVPLALAF